MKLGRAYVCYECEEVFENAPRGECPKCRSKDVHPLAWHGRSDWEKRSWFNRILGRQRGPLPERQ